jgi:hypothetical protein
VEYSTATQAALEATGSPPNGCPYAPGLNDIKIVWGQMKKSELAHQTFSNADDLDKAIHKAVDVMNPRTNRLPLVNLRIPA